MPDRLVGVDSANPRLPQGVITASQGATAADIAAGNTLALAYAYTDTVAGVVTDGTYNDIVVSGGGTVWDLVANSVTSSIIANGNVTNGKLADMAGNTIKGRVLSTGAPTDLTAAQARIVIASDSGGGIVNYFRADGTWANPNALLEDALIARLDQLEARLAALENP